MLNLATRLGRETEGAFRALYEAHYAALHRYVCRLSGDYTTAEDVVQEVFIQLWRELTTAGEPRTPRAWLYRVATNRVIDRSRSLRRTLSLILPAGTFLRPLDREAPGPSVEETTARRELVQRALRRLPEPMRQCLLLHHEGLTGREMAEVLRVKHSYVGTLAGRLAPRQVLPDPPSPFGLRRGRRSAAPGGCFAPATNQYKDDGPLKQRMTGTRAKVRVKGLEAAESRRSARSTPQRFDRVYLLC